MKSRQQVHLTVYCINVCIVMFLCSLLAHCRRVQNSVFAAAIRAIKSWWDAHQWAIRFASMWWRGQFHEHMLNWIQPKFQRRSVPVNWYSCFRTCSYTSAVAKLLIDPYQLSSPHAELLIRDSAICFRRYLLTTLPHTDLWESSGMESYILASMARVSRTVFQSD